MSAPDNAGLETALADVRTLLGTMTSSGWQQIHVRSGALEVFVSLADGYPNPMRSNGGMPFISVGSGAATVVAAPHVATLIDALSSGTTVAAGQPVARIEVLGREETLLASFTGRILEVFAGPGELLEFGVAVLSLTEVNE